MIFYHLLRHRQSSVLFELALACTPLHELLILIGCRDFSGVLADLRKKVLSGILGHGPLWVRDGRASFGAVVSLNPKSRVLSLSQVH